MSKTSLYVQILASPLLIVGSWLVAGFWLLQFGLFLSFYVVNVRACLKLSKLPKTSLFINTAIVLMVSVAVLSFMPIWQRHWVPVPVGSGNDAIHWHNFWSGHHIH